MTRPPTSHLQPMHRTPDVHEGDWLFEGVGRGDPLLEALYRVSLTQRIDVEINAYLELKVQPVEAMFDYLYADPPPDLLEQRAKAIAAEGRA